tara:strand:- start:2099 stop:2716 length:618 start_codon:yes stop_codon:yes gene_type:complete
MIINDKRKFVFVCVPKTGSTTLTKHFKNTDDIVGEKSWFKEQWHWSMSSINEKYQERIKDYYKFAYHRNPWDRLISSWIEFTRDRGHLITWSQPLKDQYNTFDEFVMDLPNSPWKDEIHFHPTAWYTHDDNDNKLVDHVARYSNFSDETKQIFDRVGLNHRPLGTKRHRMSHKDPNHRKYYPDDKMIEIVAQHFKRDIDIFGDTF